LMYLEKNWGLHTGQKTPKKKEESARKIHEGIKKKKRKATMPERGGRPIPKF